jgi:glycosyltransferase involved in cell wall biosynthesis
MSPQGHGNVLFLQSSPALGGSTYSLLDLIRILKEAGYAPVVACPKQGWLTRQLDESRTPHLTLRFYAWRKLLERPWVRRSIRKQWLPQLAAWDFKIVHSNEFWWAPHAIELSGILKVPCIVHLRDGHHTLKKARQYRLDKADLVLAVATDLRDEFIRYRKLYDKTRVLFNGHEEKLFHGDRQKARELFAVAPGEYVVGNVGKLSERKNQRLILRAMAELKRQERITRFKVLFAGEAIPEYAEQMYRDVLDLGLKEQVRFLGPLKDMAPFYAASDLLVHCALREGFPRVVPEAMLARTPVVATVAQGIRDAIPAADFGSVIAADDQRALENEIERLLKNRGLRETMADRARERARSLFSFEAHREQVLEIYRQLTRGPASPEQPPHTRDQRRWR